MNWEKLSTLGILAAVIVALIPIFKEWYHKIKITKVIRVQIFTEILQLKESLEEKRSNLEKHRPAILDENDKQMLINLENYFQKAPFLKFKEIRFFNRVVSSLRQINDKNAPLDDITIDLLYNHVYDLYHLLEAKIMERQSIELSEHELKKLRKKISKKQSKNLD